MIPGNNTYFFQASRLNYITCYVWIINRYQYFKILFSKYGTMKPDDGITLRVAEANAVDPGMA